MVAVLDPEGRYLRVNAQLEAFAGMRAADLVGRRAAELFPNLDPITTPHMEAVLATGEPRLGIQVQAELPRAPGDLRDWLLYVYPVFDNGEVVAVAVASQDVTDLTRTQAELRALTTDLERRVAERTAQVRALATDLTHAEDAERKRLALILHDDLQQLLYGAQAKLAALKRADGDAADALATQVDAALRLAVQTCRTLSVDLSPAHARAGGHLARARLGRPPLPRRSRPDRHRDRGRRRAARPGAPGASPCAWSASCCSTWSNTPARTRSPSTSQRTRTQSAWRSPTRAPASTRRCRNPGSG